MSTIPEAAINILFVITTVDGYGADKSMLTNILYLKKEGKINPLVIIPKSGPIEKQFKENGIVYYVCDHKSWTKGYKYKLLSPLKPYFKQLYNRLKAASLCKKYLKDADVQFVHTNTFTTDFGIYLSKGLGSRHTMHIREIPFEQFGFQFELPEQQIYRKVMANSSLILCNSEYTRDYFTKKLRMAPVFVPNPVFESKTSLMLRTERPGEKIRFIVAGRFEPAKNQFDVLEAVAELRRRGYRHFEVYLFGAGPLEKDYRDFVAKQTLGEIININPYQVNLFEHLQDYDIGIVPSRYEAFGRVTVEFMSKGLPVIGNNTGNTPYLVKEGYNGFIYEFQSPISLADKMEKFLVDTQRCLQHELGANANLSVDSAYSVQRSSELLWQAYLNQ